MANKPGNPNRGPKVAVQIKSNSSNVRPVVATVDGVSRTDDQSSRNIIVAAIVILLVLSGIGFLILGLAQSMQGKNGSSETKIAQTTDEKPNEQSGPQTEAKADKDTNSGSTSGGKINGAAADTKTTANNTPTSFDLTQYKQTNNTYHSNTYRKGAITGNSYVVKQGDTLWQIAQGRYGSGYAWVEINKANGGFRLLPNGEPILIEPGYKLILPN